MNNSFARGTKTASNSTFSMSGSRYSGASSIDPLAQPMYRPPPIESSRNASFASNLAVLKEERFYTASEREEYDNGQDQGDIPPMPPARTVDEFLQAEAAHQEAILAQEVSESQQEGLGQIPLAPDESGILALESWPRVDPDMTQRKL